MLISSETNDSVTHHEIESELPVSRRRPHEAPTTRQIMRSYILENFLFSDDQSAIADDASLLKLGIIDSVGALEIALFLEQNFGFSVRPAEMLPENLDSVDNLVAFVEIKQAGF